MSNDNGRHVSDVSDADIQQLMALSGPRLEPLADLEARVRAATMDAWEALPERRPSNHSRGLLAIAATALVAFVAGYQLMIPATPSPTAGKIAFATGGYTVRGPETGTTGLRCGSIVQTSQEGRLLITLAGGPTLRLDHSTGLTLHTASEIWLHSGRIYIDANQVDPVRVITPFAAIADVGTQFEVVVDGDSLHVATREGLVDVHIGDTVVRSAADAGLGEELAIEGVTIVSRKSIPTTGARWAWTQSSRPLFKVGGKTVFQFLSWAARETGRTLKFDSGLARQQAGLRRFGGRASVDADSFSVVRALATTNFQTIEGLQHELVVGFRSDRGAPAL